MAGVWPGPRRPALQLAAASNSKQPRPSNLHFQLNTLQPVRNPHEDPWNGVYLQLNRHQFPGNLPTLYFHRQLAVDHANANNVILFRFVVVVLVVVVVAAAAAVVVALVIVVLVVLIVVLFLLLLWLLLVPSLLWLLFSFWNIPNDHLGWSWNFI